MIAHAGSICPALTEQTPLKSVKENRLWERPAIDQAVHGHICYTMMYNSPEATTDCITSDYIVRVGMLSSALFWKRKRKPL